MNLTWEMMVKMEFETKFVTMYAIENNVKFHCWARAQGKGRCNGVFQ
jgi:hypothetical protein